MATNDSHLRLYDIAKGEETKILKHKERFSRISWDPVHGLLLCIAEDRIYVVDFATATMKKLLFAPGSAVTAFARHPKLSHLCAVGTMKGDVWVYDSDKGVGSKLSTTSFETHIADVSFDPKSEDYLLVATVGGRITLWGMQGILKKDSKDKAAQIMEFAKQPSGLSACKFVDSMPGTFMTTSDRHGVIRVWNVSNANPMHMIKTDQGPVTSVACLQGDSSRIAVSFKSGDVALVDLREQRTAWSSEGGHTETIFDCHLSRSDCNTLVSCSFDGTVRQYDMRTKECTALYNADDAPMGGTLGGEGPGHANANAGKRALYSCAVSCDGGVICAGGIEGKLYFFDVASGRPLKPVAVSGQPLHRIVPHPLEAGVFAAASLDGAACVATKDGVRLYMRHSFPVCGCAFDPFNPDLLATSTDKGPIMVWEHTTTDGHTPVGQLQAHAVKTYNVMYSPLVRGRLMSVSDDKTARVWSLGADGKPTDEPSVVLAGHTSNVRAMAWHTEIPHVCFTGSWDKTIRTWDVRNGGCLSVTRVHLADVYSIATHPDRPFVAVTCSRDTTMRFWSLEEICPSAKLRVAMGADVTSSATAGAGPAVASNVDKPTLVGKTVGQDGLKSKMAALGSMCEKNAAAFAVLSGEVGAAEMWQLAVIEAVGPDAKRDPTLDGGITTPHRCEVAAQVATEVALLEAVRGQRGGNGGAGAKEAALRRAASLQLQLGRIESYCDIMKELGDWNAALAAAPAVSIAFWQQVASERARVMAEAGGNLDSAIHLQLVTGQAAAAAEALRGAGRSDEAFTVACTSDAGGFPITAVAAPKLAESNGDGKGHSRMSSFGGSDDEGPPPLSETPVNVKKSSSAEPLDLGALTGALNPMARTSLPKLEPLAPRASLPPLGAKPPLGALGSGNNLLSSPGGAPVLASPTRPEKPLTPARAPRTSTTGSVGGGRVSSGGVAGAMPGSIPQSRATEVRVTQASARLSHGDAVGAAACHLSVGEAGKAARALVMGTQYEMAAALMMSLPGGAEVGGARGIDHARALLAERACALGEWELAREAAGAIGDTSARTWRLQLVCARHGAVETNSVMVENFKGKCLGGGRGGDGGDAAEAAVLKVIAGEVEAAAGAAVAAINTEIKTQGGQWNAQLLTRLLAALDVICAGSYATKTVDPRVRAEVTLLRCYLSALVVSSAGYTAVSCSLFHHARAALKQFSEAPGFPHPAAFISVQELAQMSKQHPREAAEGLREVSKTNSASEPLRAIASRLLSALESGGKVKLTPTTDAAMEAVSVPEGYMGPVDFDGEKMKMNDAIQAAVYWDAAGFTDPAFFKPPQ